MAAFFLPTGGEILLDYFVMDTRLLKMARDSDVPVCLHCMRPHSPLEHFCPHCGNTVGQLTPNIPFVSIPFEVEFLSSTWRRIWASDTGAALRVVCVLIVVMLAPLLLVGLPFVLLTAARQPKRGFDVLVKAEDEFNKGAMDAPAGTPPAPHPSARFEDRPHGGPRKG